MNRKAMSGFNLIELMIVVVIVSIIAAIALPSYQESVAKSKRADAQGALYALASAMERGFTENTTYCDIGTTAVGACGGGAGDSGTPTVLGPTVPLDGGVAYYDLTIAAVTTTTYTISATRTGSMSADKCGDFTLTSTNVQNIANQDGGIVRADCWR